MTSELQKLASDPSFLRLHRELSKFNIFKATGIGNQEIKHTRFLGYLLDPNESHGFRDEFLLRFLQSLFGVNGDIKINLLDYSLAYATVSVEVPLSSEKVPDGRRIDLIIKIPSLSNPEEYYLIAIENKIRARQGNGQLDAYKNNLQCKCKEEKKCKNCTFLYLTIDDDSNSPGWETIKYSETVLVAIRGIREDFSETLSDYIKYILDDYVAYIESLEYSENFNNLENLAAKISKEQVSALKRVSRDLIEFNRIQTRYSKGVEYLLNYDSDPRKDFVGSFKDKLIDLNKDKLKDLNLARYETSNKTYLRFSFINDENGSKLKNLSRSSNVKWLESGRNLAFELNIRPIIDTESKESADTESKTPETQKGESKYDCYVKLVLGPTGNDECIRMKIINAIREAYYSKHQDNPKVPTNFSRVWTSIVPMDSYNSKKNLNLKEVKEWIDETLSKIMNEKVNFFKETDKKLKKVFQELEKGGF